MVRLNVIELLEKKGQTKYWLWKGLGMSYGNFHKMINNETSSIKYSTIDTLCSMLECTPNELLIYDKEIEQEAK